MCIKINIKKTSAGVRHQINFKKSLLAKQTNIYKKLIKSKKSFFGRSNGRITIGHKGGGHKRKFRNISVPYFNNFSLI